MESTGEIGKAEQRETNEKMWLVAVESGLALEPLLRRSEWFDENNPRKVTRKMIEDLDETEPEAIKKILDKYDQAVSEGLDPVEALNPFRGNTMTKLLTPTHVIFEEGSALGSAYPEISRRVEQLMRVTAERKRAPHRIKRIKTIIEEKPGQKMHEVFGTLINTLEQQSRMRPDEISMAYSLGKLTSYFLRQRLGLEQPYLASPETEIAKIVGIKLEVFPDMDEKIEEVEYRYKINIGEKLYSEARDTVREYQTLTEIGLPKTADVLLQDVVSNPNDPYYLTAYEAVVGLDLDSKQQVRNLLSGAENRNGFEPTELRDRFREMRSLLRASKKEKLETISRAIDRNIDQLMADGTREMIHETLAQAESHPDNYEGRINRILEQQNRLKAAELELIAYQEK